MTRVVFLVPRREDGGHRDRLWALCRARWEHLFPDIPIVEGHHTEGPWNRSAALNKAAREAGAWDLAIVIDADVMLNRAQVAGAIERAERTGKVTWAFTEWGELWPETTERLLAKGAPTGETLRIAASDVKKLNPIAWSNCFVVPRKVWDALDGFDERFKGWGGEDTAFAAAVQGLHGWERLPGVSWNLYHDPEDRRPKSSDYAYNMRLRDRYAVALRRDHFLHDRAGGSVDAGTHRRDIHNYETFETQHRTRGFCYCGDCAREMGLPDWSRWWPTLEELVARTLPVPEVALIVHTGGAPETWPERSAYLRASLESLNAHLVLPRWERRVIWSDWGDLFRGQVEDIADEFGFYLPSRLTSERRLGYTASMQAKWRYIAGVVKAPYVFATEDDFLIERNVDVAAMVATIDAHPKLAQVALLRGPLNDRERTPDTILGHPCDAFQRRETYLEHQRFFTCNPSLFRRTLAERSWPSGAHSEAVYGRALFASGLKAGLWGQGERWISHIGETRAGGPY